jgi:exodeoxyribonuclease V alpha subunit
MTTETVIEGVVERITFESPSSSFRVIKVSTQTRSEPLTLVGPFPRIAVGTRIRARGTLENNRTHGEQLRVQSVVELAPATLAGLQKYLASGLVKGVGDKLACRIVETFGLASLRVIEETPDRLHEVAGLGQRRAVAIANAWRDHRVLRDLMVTLHASGASTALAARIVRRYGALATTVVSQEPYRLALDVGGVGFRTADRIAASIGIAKDSAERIQAGALQAIHDFSDAGHVWTEMSQLVSGTIRLLDLETEDEATKHRVSQAVQSLVLSGRVVIEKRECDATEWAVYASAMHAAEVRLARRLTEIVRAPGNPLAGVADSTRAFEERANVRLTDEQREAVEQAARCQMLVITGGPGVGKTTILRAVLSMLEQAGTVVRLAAPTGRAARRMSDSAGAEATTLHRLLEFDPKSATFKRDRAHPIDAGAIIVDEASMIDLLMADALTQAVAPGTRLLLVGDVDQLPSVGAGAVLRDVIASGTIPCVRLRRIFRQSTRSLIVTNAHRINDGEVPIAQAEGSNSDFFVVLRRDPDQARQTIVELVTSRIPQRFGLDPVRDVQVLTPMNRGPVGSVALNQTLQAVLNPNGLGLNRGTRTFRIGDKVMQLRNDYDKNIYNGDVGQVTSIENETLTVRFDARDLTFDATDMDDLTLAYACTIHKSQGSEYPAVVIVLMTAHFVMLGKNLLYTAVTRGRRLVVLVTDRMAMQVALSDQRREHRRTHLAVRLAGSLTRHDSMASV